MRAGIEVPDRGQGCDTVRREDGREVAGMSEEINNIVGRIRLLPRSIARDVWPNGAILTCRRCSREERIGTKTCGTFLREGWPKCCGYTMRLERVDND